ncbi:MAG: hypothetical protein IPG45_20025 [Deltaproteobacteria bacterium]|nr:hypothetical protein [Deltaproteobacteria bacterium]
MIGDPKELKKQVCRTLTNVLKASSLREQIDPKAFFLMVNSNFALLFHTGKLDLSPIYDALLPQHGPDLLDGFFVQLAEAATNLGLEVGLPRQLAAQTIEERQAAQQRFSMTVDGDLSRSEISSSGLTPLPALLADDALKPLISDELRRNVVQATVNAIKGAPVGKRVDSAQLAFLIDSNFDQLCDGETFDFQPILDGLRGLGAIDDSEIYVAVVKLRSSLQELKLQLSEVKLSVDDTLGARLVADAKRAEARTSAEAYTVATTKTSSIDLPKPEEKRAANKEERLRDLGLGKGNSRTFRLIRMGLMAAVLVVTAVVAFLTRDNRPLDAADLGGAIPLRSAELRDGALLLVVDDSQWYSLPSKERHAKLEALEAILNSKGLTNDMQGRDSKGRLIITAKGPGALSGAVFFMFGNADGTVPPGAYKPAETLPAKKSK